MPYKGITCPSDPQQRILGIQEYKLIRAQVARTPRAIAQRVKAGERQTDTQFPISNPVRKHRTLPCIIGLFSQKSMF
jgi:hypothetical protein